MISLRELSLMALCDALNCDAALPPMGPIEIAVIQRTAAAFLRTLGADESKNPLASLRQIRKQALIDMEGLHAEHLKSLPFDEALSSLLKLKKAFNLFLLYHAIKRVRINTPDLAPGSLEEQARAIRIWLRNHQEICQTLEFLNFSNLPLTELPKEIRLFPNLEYLNLTNTKICTLSRTPRPPCLQFLYIADTPLGRYCGVRWGITGEGIPLFFAPSQEGQLPSSAASHVDENVGAGV